MFTLSKTPSESFLKLLSTTVLGTNGAKYRHLDTSKRIYEIDQPTFITLERNNKALGGIALCQRGNHWYLRYYAFNKAYQSSSGVAKKETDKTVSTNLKQKLEGIFETLLTENGSIYAYIEPNNIRSLNSGFQFGFTPVARIATQTFSRVSPQLQPTVSLVDTNERHIALSLLKKTFQYHRFFFDANINNKHPLYCMRDKDGTIIALAKTYLTNWEIEQLPGKFGTFKTRLIPLIPRLNKIIKPSNHRFITLEGVFVQNNNPELTRIFFEGILAATGTHSLIWWVDENDPFYAAVKNTINWGILHRLNGTNEIHLVEKGARKTPIQQPFYVSGFDFI